MNVLIGVTGSVATIKLPELVHALTQCGHEVQVVATDASTYFFCQGALLPIRVWRDEDEWNGTHYERGQKIPHIELRRWADVLLIAPLSANTLAKIAHGMCDNLLTSVVRAWDFSKPIVLAPAMNTHMWYNRFTRDHLDRLVQMFGPKIIRVVDPIKKRLACEDVGMGAMAKVETIVAVIESL